MPTPRLNHLALRLLVMCFVGTLRAQLPAIVPAPVSYATTAGADFVLTRATVLHSSSNPAPPILAFNAMLEQAYGFALSVQSSAVAPSGSISIAPMPGATGLSEAYKITVSARGIAIEHAPNGLMPALATLLQLLPAKPFDRANIRSCTVTDAPRFGYRGLHLDVSRHFLPVDGVLRFIDLMARFKFNTFHWHLTDDQGWRLEIKRYPKLTEIGATRGGTIVGRHPGTANTNQPHGGYYTHADVALVVKYAADRGITILPEIELPGHSSAAIAAYPWLSCFPERATPQTYWNTGEAPRTSPDGRVKLVQETWGVFDDVFCPTDSTFKFLENVLDEVMALFPGKYIHIGGDECPKTAWRESAFCQNLIKTNQLKDEHGLQSYFIRRIEKYLNAKGRQIMGWDEILEGGLAPNATVMSWRGEAGGIAAAQQGHRVVMTPGEWVYLDHSQSKFEDSVTIGGHTSLAKTYSYEPVPASLDAVAGALVLGAQGNVWTEYISNRQKLDYMVFPRMVALSEVLWSPKNKRNWNDFSLRLPALFDRLDALGVGYSSAVYDLDERVVFDEQGKPHWHLSTAHPTATITVNTPPEAAKLPIGKATPDGAAQPNGGGNQWSLPNRAPGAKQQTVDFTAPGQYTAELLLPSGKKQTVSRTRRLSLATDGAFALGALPSNYAFLSRPWLVLTDGFSGNTRQVRGAEWLGWQGQDGEVTAKLSAVGTWSKLVFCGLHQPKSWIYHPQKLTVLTSVDGKTYQPVASSQFGPDIKIEPDGKFRWQIALPPTQAGFIKLVATNFGKIPAGANGEGEAAWLFADEIEVYQ
jgi:hexosaminidase